MDGLLSLIPYQTDLNFGGNAIRMDTKGEVFTSGRFEDVAARFVGYAIVDTGSYSICLDSDDKSEI